MRIQFFILSTTSWVNFLSRDIIIVVDYLFLSPFLSFCYINTKCIQMGSKIQAGVSLKKKDKKNLYKKSWHLVLVRSYLVSRLIVSLILWTKQTDLFDTLSTLRSYVMGFYMYMQTCSRVVWMWIVDNV